VLLLTDCIAADDEEEVKPMKGKEASTPPIKDEEE